MKLKKIALAAAGTALVAAIPASAPAVYGRIPVAPACRSAFACACEL